MAGNQKFSFNKRGAVKKNFIKGTNPSLHNSQLLISSGIPSLDGLIGGGIPVGSLLLINEDEYNTYAEFMLKYFMSEGIASQHSLFFASDDFHLEKLIEGLPSQIHSEAEVKEEDELEETQNKMIIAWRYQNLKKYSHEINKYFGHYFDLSKNICSEVIKNSDITLFSSKEGEFREGTLFQETKYFALLKAIEKKLKEGLYFANESNFERNILRIVLFQINSPLWSCASNSESEEHLLTFLYSLRALLRNAYATCYFTLSYSMHKKNLVQKCIHFADTAVQLQSFTGTSYENLASFKNYNGFFIIQKLAAINTLMAHNSHPTNLAFKMRRKKLTIEAFYLPPELEDTEESAQDDSTVLMCSSSKSNKLDF